MVKSLCSRQRNFLKTRSQFFQHRENTKKKFILDNFNDFFFIPCIIIPCISRKFILGTKLKEMGLHLILT